MQARLQILISALLLTLVVPTLAPAAPSVGPRPTVHERSLELSKNPSATFRGPAAPTLGDISRMASPGSVESITSSSITCGSWSTLSPHTAAFTRDGHCMVYDPVRDRMLVFGGATGTPDGGASHDLTNEVWALSLGASPTLTQVTTSGTPPEPRETASMIYDSVRDRLVIFGGSVGSSFTFDDVWALSLAGTPTWTQITPSGTPPWANSRHSAIYDVTRDRMVVFGGYGGTESDEVWTLSFAGTPTWSQMTPSGTSPVARSYHTAVYDGPRDRMVVFGGYSSTSTPTSLDDSWALSLSGSGAWSQITTNTDPPGTRYGHTAIVDAPRNRMIVFSGFSDDTPYRYGDVWTLSFTNPIKWTQLAPTGPNPWPASYFASAYDPVRQRMISYSADEAWAMGNLAGTPSWSMLNLPNQVPRGRVVAHTIYDAPRQRMLMFGGFPSPEFWSSNDLWTYPLNGSGGWTRIVPTGVTPPPIAAGTAIYDPVGDRMILFGGGGDASDVNDTWQLSLGGTPSWTKLAPSGTLPPARSSHAAILDAPRNRMVIFGGYAASGPLSDTWALSLAGGTSWSQINAAGPTPPALGQGNAVFDATRNRMLVFGGEGFCCTFDTDVWALSLAGSPTWSILATTGTPPQLIRHVAAYDPVRDQMLVGMGEAPSGWAQNTMYALTLSGTPTWGTVGLTTPPPPEASNARLVYDSANDRMVVCGGLRYASGYPQLYMNDVVALSFPPAYPLNLAASPVAGGTVDASPSGACQLSDAMVTLTAVPAASYGFTGWTGDASGTTNPITVTMNAAKNITANFATYAVNVTVSPSGAGTVSKNPNQSSYPPGSQVTLTATPAFGYGFAGWSGDAGGTTNPLTLTVDANKNITASFFPYTINVTISPPFSGNVTKSPNQTLYAPGTQVTLTAVNSHGFPFLNWSGDATGTTNPIVVTVDGTKNVTAAFDARLLTTQVSPAGTGSVNLNPVHSNNLYGAEPVTLTAIPAPGYAFDSWSGDATGSVSPISVFMDAHKTVTATFVAPPPACGNWSVVSTSTRPNPRRGTPGIWDPIRSRMLIFGGEFAIGTTVYNDVWQLTLGGSPAWSQLAPSGTAPSVRSYSTAVYDPVRDRLLVFGGRLLQTRYNEVWALSLSGSPAWTQILPSGTPPAARHGHAMIYDSLRDRLIVFAGSTPQGMGNLLLNDVWALSLAGTPTWTQVTTSGTPPLASTGYSAIYDPVRDRMVTYLTSGSPPRALSLSGTPTWTTLSPAGPPHGGTNCAVYDAARDRMLLPPGVDNATSALTFDGPVVWSSLNRGGPSIGNFSERTAVCSDGGVLIVFGGGNGGSATDQTFRFDLGTFSVDGGADNGSALLEACYGSGEVVPVVAAPASGYKFSHWLGDLSGTGNPGFLTMDGYKVVQPVFVTNTTDANEDSPLSFALGRVHPNPGPGPVTIEYSLARESRVALTVFDVSGREVVRLVDGVRDAGRHTTGWDGRMGGARARSGVYLVRYETAVGNWSRRFVLLR